MIISKQYITVDSFSSNVLHYHAYHGNNEDKYPEPDVETSCSFTSEPFHEGSGFITIEEPVLIRRSAYYAENPA